MNNEQVEELQPTREELKDKLRSKIHQKKKFRNGGITRKTSQTLKDKMDKLTKILIDENITSDTPINEHIIDIVTSVISIDEMNKIFEHIGNHPEVSDNFKDFVHNILNFKPP